MREKVYCNCSNCLNHKEKEILYHSQCVGTIKDIVCENSKEVSIYHAPSDTVRRTCSNYKPKEKENA